MIRAASLAAALALLAACAPTSSPRVPDDSASLTPRPTLTVSSSRFLALGDSYTLGEGVETSDAWPYVLARRLAADGLDVGDPTVVALTGWTTDELSAAIRAAESGLAPPYALVTLLIGVNDQYRGRPVADYRAPFRALLDRAIGFAGGDAGKVVVVSVPDWGLTPFAEGRDRAAIADAIDAYNAVAREEADAAGARWVDVTEATRRYPSLVVADGLHPNSVVYRNWAEAIAPAARAALAPGR